MAAAHTMTMRQQPMALYTPQANSPASAHSPQQDSQGRTVYAQTPQPSNLYYSHYPVQQHPSYIQQAGIPQPQSSPAHNAMGMQFPPYPPQQRQGHQMHQQSPHMPHRHQQQQMKQQAQQLRQSPHMDNSPRSKVTPSASIQRPVSAQMGPPQIPASVMPTSPVPSQQLSTGVGGQSAAPGPIPATTPRVVKSDQNGVQWIMFEYSRDRIKVQYEIRCDVASVNIQNLDQQFKDTNCVYPKACSDKEPYKGNRLQYETDCNEVGWALADLNPSLRGKRGLIQRAVDSWRNSNSDSKLRSRRVRRMAKSTKRSQNQQAHPTIPSSSAAPQPSPTSMMELPGGLPATSPVSAAQLHHHHMQQSSAAAATEEQHHQNQNHSAIMASSNNAQQMQSYYSNWAAHQTKGPPQMPSMHNMNQLSSHGQVHAIPTPTPTRKVEYGEEEAKFFSDIAKVIPRKSITVKDIEKDTNVRVNVKLDGVSLDEIPDSFRQKNSVYPRSYYARHMQSPPRSGASSVYDDSGIDTVGARFAPSVGRIVVPVTLQDNWETELAIPRTTKSRRTKERALNDLGCRMTWDYVQNFTERPLFVQRSREYPAF